MSQEYKILIVDDSGLARRMARDAVAKAAPDAIIIAALCIKRTKAVCLEVAAPKTDSKATFAT